MADIEGAKLRWGDPNSNAIIGGSGSPNITTDIDVTQDEDESLPSTK